jgi:hypothetical protein
MDELEILEEVVEAITSEPLPVLQLLATPKKTYYKAIASFSIGGFREVLEGECITISPDVIRDLGLADKVLQEKK